MTLKLLSLIVLFSLTTKAATLIIPVIVEAEVSVYERKPDDPPDQWRLGDVSSDHVKLYFSTLIIGFSGGPNPPNFTPSKPRQLLQWHFVLDPNTVNAPYDLRYANDPRAIYPGIIVKTFPAGTNEFTIIESYDEFEYYHAPDFLVLNDTREIEIRTYGPNLIINQNIIPQIPEPNILHLVCVSLIYNVLNRRKNL